MGLAFMLLSGLHNCHVSLGPQVLTTEGPPLPAPAENSVLGRLAGPLGSAAARAVLEPVVTSVVILRDKVEQDRFVVR